MSFFFDIDEFIKYEQHLTDLYLDKKKKFINHELLDIVYEDLVHNFDSTMADVYKFLNIKEIQNKPQTIKIENRPIDEIIENYDEAMQQLKDYGYDY